jgi:hypothetical protein
MTTTANHMPARARRGDRRYHAKTCPRPPVVLRLRGIALRGWCPGCGSWGPLPTPATTKTPPPSAE